MENQQNNSIEIQGKKTIAESLRDLEMGVESMKSPVERETFEKIGKLGKAMFDKVQAFGQLKDNTAAQEIVTELKGSLTELVSTLIEIRRLDSVIMTRGTSVKDKSDARKERFTLVATDGRLDNALSKAFPSFKKAEEFEEISAVRV